MSAHTKKPHTNNSVEVTIGGNPELKFIIPRPIFTRKISELLAPFEVTDEDDSVPAAQVFKHLDEKYGEIGANIRGCRARDSMTQTQLAKKLGIRQSHVSEMEHSRRVIGKKMAQKLAKIFNTDYRMFL